MNVAILDECSGKKVLGEKLFVERLNSTSPPVATETRSPSIIVGVCDNSGNQSGDLAVGLYFEWIFTVGVAALN
jgi:hypothetical protein